jgi:poly(3-hydroxybutyrate) depolymerase
MPLIVAFHGLYSNNHSSLLLVSQDTGNNWDLLTDATDAGFAVLMPKAGVPYAGTTVATWGRPQMHLHVAAAIGDVLSNYSTIDPDRIYGYGFSMGGDDVLSYAARHLDPTEAMFAPGRGRLLARRGRRPGRIAAPRVPWMAPRTARRRG